MQPSCGNDDVKSRGFVKLMRSAESQELLANDPLAFALLAVIALRARWRSASFNVLGLKLGEALVGDYDKMGFTRRRYRTRLARLAKLKLIVTRPIRKGTVAALTSTDVFDINLLPNENLTSEQTLKKRPAKRPSVSSMKKHDERPTERPTGGQQATNGRPLTKKERRKQGNNDHTHTHAGTGQTGAARHASRNSSSILNLEEAKKDSLWRQFENYCISNGGSPTLKGWKTWRSKQSPNGAKPRLTSMKSKDLQLLRHKLIAERNSGEFGPEENQVKREQLLEIKQILKGRGIEYPASI
jgi:hypothetical protein